ncbi:MAG: hypothetical protein ACK55I_12085, partial [bacterium]
LRFITSDAIRELTTGGAENCCIFIGDEEAVLLALEFMTEFKLRFEMPAEFNALLEVAFVN